MTEMAARWSAHMLAGALALGLVAANVTRGSSALVAAAAVAAAGAAAFARSPRARLAALGLALVLAGWWWGSSRLEALDRSVLAPQIGAGGDAFVVVTAPARRSPYEIRVPARVLRFRGRVLSEPVQLELPPGRAPPQGAELALFGVVAAPEQDEEFDERAWLRLRGVHVVLRVGRWRVVGARGGVGGVADRLRRALVRGLDGLEGERRAVLAGIVLGEDEGLDEDLRDAFRASGLYHLLAVSGQNVALLAVGVMALAWLFGVSNRVAQLAILGAIAAYVLAVGWQPSVVRAGVAGGLAALAWLTARERDRWWLLLVGAIVLLAWNPYTVREPGFQLSFVAVLAIFVGTPRVLRVLEGYPVPTWLAIVVAVSVSCGLATAPVLWLHFGAVPVYSVVANALAAPVVGALLGLALVAGVLAPVAPSAALALAWLDGWLAAYLIGCARAVAGLPFAQLTSPRALLVVLGAAAAVVVLSRLRAPRGLRALVLASSCALAFAGWSVARRSDPAPPPSGLRVTFLDVGQGDGILLEAPGARILIDQGPPEARVASQLERLGISRLTALVLTHPQRDHVGGAADVLRGLRVGFVLDPGLATTAPEQTEALATARARGVPVVAARAGRTFRIGRLRLAVLWPDGPGFRGEDPNLRAVVLLASYGEVDVLLTADAESPVTLALAPPVVEVLKVAHHGSRDGGLALLLDETRPRIAVISAGAENEYGHPAPSTLRTLAREPALRLFRTDEDGRVVLESDGRGIWVRSER